MRQPNTARIELMRLGNPPAAIATTKRGARLLANSPAVESTAIPLWRAAELGENTLLPADAGGKEFSSGVPHCS